MTAGLNNMEDLALVQEPTNEELWFSWYLNELLERSFITSFVYQPRTFIIGESYTYTTYKRFKTKPSEPRSHTLISEYKYTPDFKVFWHPTALDYFLRLIDPRVKIYDHRLPFIAQTETTDDNNTAIVSYIDTKGAVSIRVVHQDGLTKFPYKQHMMWTKYHIYINKTVVPTIFKQTFTPDRFLRTNVKEKDRVIHYTPKTLDLYLQSKSQSYDTNILTEIGISN